MVRGRNWRSRRGKVRIEVRKRGKGKTGNRDGRNRKKSAWRRGNWRSRSGKVWGKAGKVGSENWGNRTAGQGKLVGKNRQSPRQSREKWCESRSDAGGRTVRPRPCVGASWPPGSPGRRAAAAPRTAPVRNRSLAAQARPPAKAAPGWRRDLRPQCPDLAAAQLSGEKFS